MLCESLVKVVVDKSQLVETNENVIVKLTTAENKEKENVSLGAANNAVLGTEKISFTEGTISTCQ